MARHLGDGKPFLFLPVPCARCGAFLPFLEAVKASGDGWSGFVHAGACDPADVARYANAQAYHQQSRIRSFR